MVSSYVDSVVRNCSLSNIYRIAHNRIVHKYSAQARKILTNLMNGQRSVKLRPPRLFLCDIFPMKTAVDLKIFFSSNFMHGPFIKI